MKEPTYQMTFDQISRERQTARAKGREEGLLMAMQICGLILNDHFGFGKQRGEKFIKEAAKLCEEYNEGRLNAGDIEDALFEAWEIKFEKKGKK